MCKKSKSPPFLYYNIALFQRLLKSFERKSSCLHRTVKESPPTFELRRTKVSLHSYNLFCNFWWSIWSSNNSQGQNFSQKLQFFSVIVKKRRKNCECCHHHSLFKGHNVIVHIVVLNCQKRNQCLKCHVSGHKNFQKLWKLPKILKTFKNCQNC